MKLSVDGLREEPQKRASGALYSGRFTCHKVQWTKSKNDLLATFTITARELVDVADNGLLWTDQDVQRGIKPGLTQRAEREISLANGAPNPTIYIFDKEKAGDIAEKLLNGSRLFLNPLVWNLRPGKFSAYWNDDEEDLYLYSGRIYLPDSHHRHQAILKAIRAYDECPGDYPEFAPDMQLKVELYFLSKEDEGNYFFDKNQRPKPTSKSKAYDLTTQDDLSLLSKRVIDHSEALQQNVNRVTDRLNASNPQVITLSTLRQMMGVIAPTDAIDETEIDGIAIIIATFYDLLAQSRYELGLLDTKERKQVRSLLLVDSAVMMYGYAYLIIDFNNTITKEGLNKAIEIWDVKLCRLRQQYKYGNNWKGDIFSRQCALWVDLGVLKPSSKSGRMTLSNTGASRAQCGRVLRQLMSLAETPSDISFLAER